MRRGLMLAAAMAALTVAGSGVAGSGVAGAATGSWTTEKVPLPAGITHAALYGVSCSQPANCVSVGSSLRPKADTSSALAEGWNGSSWVVQSTPAVAGAVDPELLAVSCPSATDCTAVGDYLGSAGTSFALAEQWNGSSWAVQAAPSPDTNTGLTGVDCRSANWCTAVGYSGGKLIAEHWNGSGWTDSFPPSPPKTGEGEALLSISCSSTTTCAAGGWYDSTTTVDQPLAERWSGGTWKVVATPLPTGASLAELQGMSCASAVACTATGWAATASGAASALAESWNGTAWTVEPTARPAAGQGLLAVSCAAAQTCTAVGESPVESGVSTLRPVAEQQQ
jgi:hypothetical protein